MHFQVSVCKNNSAVNNIKFDLMGFEKRTVRISHFRLVFLLFVHLMLAFTAHAYLSILVFLLSCITELIKCILQFFVELECCRAF